MNISPNLNWYLKNHGWALLSKGAAGELWRHERGSVIAVPWKISPGDLQWYGLIERIARPTRSAIESVASAIEHAYMDVTDFRAADDILIEGSIPIEAGYSLISTARTIFRASATTSKGARAQIGGNYSRPAERIVEKARFAHTKKGSYILPMLVPVEDLSLKKAEDVYLFSAEYESEERRATRTMAQALSAVQTLIVDPAKEPTRRIVDDLVLSGVSREMMNALHSVVMEEAVSEFSAEFFWAGALPPNETLPRKISIPSGSSELLQMTADKMRPTRDKRTESFTGPIVQLRDEESLTYGEVNIQTVRKGRSCEITVVLRDEELRKSHQWFDQKETLVVEGEVEAVHGKGLKILAPIRVETLRNTLLFS
ncbi:hypothetical protein [Arthrobacter sp. JUb115]|uniref:hypothetical protein n=1 Tax=Arthrobacter sp. JUb115 TaxID=2485108 RepID=UPI00105F1523|nr:hypothetical protein [Arthrobacter sp. JUb115]TDU30546.1 hypothetical protein EDF61_101507 [Arthrobacter sp. JUb115]